MVKVRYKKLASGKFSAYLDIYSNNSGEGPRNYEFLKIYVSKDYSDPKTRIAEVDKDNMKVINAIRNSRETDTNFSENGYKKPGKTDYNLINYFRQCLKSKYNYRLECVTIQLEKYYGKRTVYFQDVDNELLDTFQTHLLNTVSQNTANSYMCTFRQFFNKLVTKGILKTSPFSTFKVVSEADVEKTTLTMEEVRALAEYIPKRGNPQIKEAFLFSCFTGLRLSDVKKFTYDEIIGDEIVFRPAKTSKKIVRVPLVDDAKAIIASLPKHPKNSKVFWNLPSGQVINTYLKFFGLGAGIQKNLHFHAARHTFATIGLTYGIDIYTMKELLGHSKIEMTQIYAKIVDQKKAMEMAKFPKL
jgi:Site-specific recombinase XerD